MSTTSDNLQPADGQDQNQNTNQPLQEHQFEEEQPNAQEEDVTQVEEMVQVEGKQVEDNDKEDAPDKIPFKDYKSLTAEVLIGEAENLLKNHPVHLIRKHIYEIKNAINQIFDADEAQKKQKFQDEGGNPIDFYYENTSKSKFFKVYGDYKKQLDAYNKNQEKQEEENLIKRQQIIEKLKQLYLEPSENNSELFKIFRELKTEWNNAGRIPRSKSRDVFRNYYHHLDNFYQYLNLNKELQNMDYEHNLEVRKSIIKRSEELLQEPNIQKALNELQYLHKLWKEEAVPVAEEFRDQTWDQFKELTQKIHQRKEELYQHIKQEQLENLSQKQTIIESIKQLCIVPENQTHGFWQKQIKAFETLRTQFKKAGRVPREHNNQVWEEFKTVSRTFNHQKNDFYKSIKSQQNDNLEKKLALLEIAKQHRDSEDWENAVKEIKKIQTQWKKIGHVPRSHSDKIWSEFKEACNHFFDRYKANNQTTESNFYNNYKAKQEILEQLKSIKNNNTKPKETLDTINQLSVQWSTIGKIPRSKMDINQAYQNLLSDALKELNMSDTEIQEFKANAILQQIIQTKDEELLDREIYKIRKQIDEIEKEYKQLETNISFFSNANENNPLVKDVQDKIQQKKEQLTEKEILLRKLSSLSFDEEPATQNQPTEQQSKDQPTQEE